MEFNSEAEKLFYLYTLECPKFFDKTRKDYFKNPDIKILFAISKKYFEKFKESTSCEQLKVMIKSTRYKDQISNEVINQLFDVDLKEYDEDWLESTIKSWIKLRSLETSIIESVEFIKTQKIDSDNIDAVVEKVRGIVQEKNNISFDTTFGVNFANAADHKIDITDRLPSGKVFFDRLSGGGIDPKTLTVIAGEQNSGKSIWLANDAANFYRQGKNVAVISGEMAEKKFLKRIGSNLLDVHMDEYEVFARDPHKVQAKLNYITDSALIPPGNLHVKQMAAPTVPQIEMYLREFEEKTGVKLDVIIIDYINILTNYRNPNSENTYLKIKQIAEDLRSMAIRNNWIIITATQLGKQAWDNSDITMADIAESAGLSHTADTIFAIIQDSDMRRNREYWLKILKIRDGGGKNTKCLFSIDYSRMRITEQNTVITPEQ